MSAKQSMRSDCPCCGVEGLLPMKGYEGYYLHRCKGCTFVYAAKVPTASELEEHYAHKYDKKYTPHAWVSATTRERLAELISSFSSYRKHNRLLDVGCGHGLLLEAAQRAGWSSFGTEYSKDAIEIGAERGFTMHQGELKEGDLPLEYFDVIVMTESIEHMPEPRAAVATVAGLLREGGLLYLTTPNFDSLSRRALGARWNVIEYPAHLSYFGAESLCRLFEELGLFPRKIETTGFSPTRLKKSLLGQEHPSTSSSDVDERVRNALDSNWKMRLLKRTLNRTLSVSRLGDTLKAELVKGRQFV